MPRLHNNGCARCCVGQLRRAEADASAFKSKFKPKNWNAYALAKDKATLHKERLISASTLDHKIFLYCLKNLFRVIFAASILLVIAVFIPAGTLAHFAQVSSVVCSGNCPSSTANSSNQLQIAPSPTVFAGQPASCYETNFNGANSISVIQRAQRGGTDGGNNQGGKSYPISPQANCPTSAAANIVSVNLSATTGQVVHGTEFGLAATMGTANHDYASYRDPRFLNVANRYPTNLFRHNWELNTFMDIIFPSRTSVSSPKFAYLDNFLDNREKFKRFFNSHTGLQIVTLGFPSWIDISNLADQALYAQMVVAIARHFSDKGMPVHWWDLVNEPDGHFDMAALSNIFNVTDSALKAYDPANRLGGLALEWNQPDNFATFFRISGPHIGFISWHQYVTDGRDGKSNQQIVNDSMNNIFRDAQAIRSQARKAGISDRVPLFVGEYNIDGAIYDDPRNGNIIGAVGAAAATYAMIASNTNCTMGALWTVVNGSAYSVFGSQPKYAVDPIGVTLSWLGEYMPGNLVQTVMPRNTPGLVGYATKTAKGFSLALINTNLSQGYGVDISKNGFPPHVKMMEINGANPQGSKSTISTLTNVNVPAGSVIIIAQ
jgi:hypothetical protein